MTERAKQTKKEGDTNMQNRGLTIIVECVGCKEKKTLTGDEIPTGDMPPFCDKCYCPMVAIRASTSSSLKRLPKEKRREKNP